jgi:hypothetical protein
MGLDSPDYTKSSPSGACFRNVIHPFDDGKIWNVGPAYPERRTSGYRPIDRIVAELGVNP